MKIPECLKIRADFPPGMRKSTVLLLCLAEIAAIYVFYVALPQYLEERREERMYTMVSEAKSKLGNAVSAVGVDEKLLERVYVENFRAHIFVHGWLLPDKRKRFLNDFGVVRESYPDLFFDIHLETPPNPSELLK